MKLVMRKTFLSVVGTRPQFLKLFPLAEQLRRHSIKHIIVHSNQHYDNNMSSIFFDLFPSIKPDYLLVNISLDEILLKETPDYVIVYGDCKTTLDAAIVAKRKSFPIIHVEAGLRSYNPDMPEEINRVCVDHMSDVLLCPTEFAVQNLEREGITKNVHIVGNLQIELLRRFIPTYNNTGILEINGLKKNTYYLMTLHRHYNTNKEQISAIFEQIGKISGIIVFPIHPRTKKVIDENNISIPPNLICIDPVNCLDMSILLRHCIKVITDSGGLQTEAYYLKKPCITVRSETEWINTIHEGRNILVTDITTLAATVRKFNFINCPPITINKEKCSSNIVAILHKLCDVAETEKQIEKQINKISRLEKDYSSDVNAYLSAA